VKFLLPFTFAINLIAQESQFGVQSRLVLIPATVTDAKGHAVEGLEAADFVVLDNGRPMSVSVDSIGTGVAPIALVIAIQASGISKPVLEKVTKIGALIQPLVTGDRGCAAVMSFSERIVWLQECTRDEEAITGALAKIRPGADKGARMLDAVHEAVERLRQHRNSRLVLLLISESRDRGSETALDQIAVDVQNAGVTLYAATYSAFRTAFTTRSSATGEPHPPKRPQKPSDETGTATGGLPSCGPLGCPAPQLPSADQRVDLLGGFDELIRLGKTNTVEVLTKTTGGLAFPFTRLAGLEQAIQKLGADLHSQYLLSFTPDDATRSYHRLEVRVKDTALHVRARPGYWSTSPPNR